MKKFTYVGLDVHKDTIAVAVAQDGRGGEIRFFWRDCAYCRFCFAAATALSAIVAMVEALAQ